MILVVVIIKKRKQKKCIFLICYKNGQLSTLLDDLIGKILSVSEKSMATYKSYK